ncbi:MAG TPA: N-acetylmuramoyl-L-alanine amidase [Pseudolabrys sp.]|nr:N-acetylmuramoyl-L-alanine amidase [Pseudolabrys sp.]
MGEFGRITAIAAALVALPLGIAAAQTTNAPAAAPAATPEVAPAPTTTPAPAAAPAVVAATCATRANFRVVLDVGHTPESPGAKSARGIDEYVFNLRLAKVIDQALRDAGFSRTVLMTTDGPGIRSMYVRVAHANDLDANLLLSIHHDSVPDRFLEKWDFNGKKETYSDRFKGHSIFVSDDNVDIKDSLAFGSLLGQQLKARGLQFTPHYAEGFMGHYQHTLLDAEAGVYRYDTLFVLKKSHMPAVLLEAGSIANRDEELVLETPERQQMTAAAVVAAVDAFCAAGPKKPVATQVAEQRSKVHQAALSAHSRRHVRTATTASATIVQSNLDSH